jgi:hypothetical protein
MLTNKKEGKCLRFLNVEIGGGPGLSLPPILDSKNRFINLQPHANHRDNARNSAIATFCSGRDKRQNLTIFIFWSQISWSSMPSSVHSKWSLASSLVLHSLGNENVIS